MNIRPILVAPEYAGQLGRASRGADVFARRLGTLYPLQPHELAAAADLVQDIAPVSPHHEIFEVGKPAPEALVLLEGLACHYRIVDSERRQITGFVLPGDFCDFGFLSSSPVRQNVRTLGPAVLGRIDLGQISALANTLPNIAVAGMRGASIEQACTRELVVNLGARNALQRLAHCVCELFTRLREVDLARDGSPFDLALTQAELGEALGLSTVHVNRMVQHLRHKKLITMGKRVVRILDFPGLAAVAGFDGRYLLS